MHLENSTSMHYRQIRAQYDDSTITVYQAYSEEIATAAVAQQRLDASPSFSLTRMTWIKPSWAWMLYRSGYSYKDSRQTNILAIRMTHRAFKDLLRQAIVAHNSQEKPRNGVEENDRLHAHASSAAVRVQWDPERSIRLERLAHRSIQIGIPNALVPGWIDGIVGIEDVTSKARELKALLDKEGEGKVALEQLIDSGCVPVEQEYEVDEELRKVLCMD